MELNQENNAMSMEDLLTLDLEGTEATYQVRAQPGKYLVKVVDAEPDTVDTDDGIITVVKLAFEAIAEPTLDRDTDADGEPINAKDLIGARILHTFWLRNQDDAKRMTGFFKSYLGEHPKMKLPDLLATLKQGELVAYIKVIHKKNKDNPAMPYVNIAMGKKDVVGHKTLVEQGVIG